MSFDNAGIGRYGNFAIRKRIEGINGLVCRNTRRQLNFNFHLFGGVVDYFLYLKLTAVVGFQNRINQTTGGGAVRNLPNNQGLLIVFFDPCPATDFSSTITVLVKTNIDHAPGCKIRVQGERLLAQYFNGSLDQLHEIMRQYFGR